MLGERALGTGGKRTVDATHKVAGEEAPPARAQLLAGPPALVDDLVHADLLADLEGQLVRIDGIVVEVHHDWNRGAKGAQGTGRVSIAVGCGGAVETASSYP